jgi:hypothetical protein
VNHDVDFDVSAPRSAGLLLEIFPIGQPGRVGLSVFNVGPETLSQAEAIRTLLAAAEQLAASGTWRAEIPESLRPRPDTPQG